MAMLLGLVVLVSASCTFELINLNEPAVVAFRTDHGRYITATDEEEDWLLTQETTLSACGQFIQHHLANGRISLETCHDRYVTAPQGATSRLDARLAQESQADDRGEFDLYELGNERVAFKTGRAKFFTAGDGDWNPPGSEWSVVAETEALDNWEVFTVLTPTTHPPPMIANFDHCQGVTNRGGPTGIVLDPNSDDWVEATFVPNAERGCVARLEYKMVGAIGFWGQLRYNDWSPFSQLVFDIRLDSPENAPQRAWVELKRASGQEVALKELAEITTEWQTMILSLTEFEEPLSSFADIEELVFMFEAGGQKKAGVFYLDNIDLRQVWIEP
jgi:hypothetical protein